MPLNIGIFTARIRAFRCLSPFIDKRLWQLPNTPPALEAVGRYGTLVMPPHIQDEVQKRSLQDPESFWGHHAEQLCWHKKPSQVLKETTKELPSGVSHPHWTWFPDGEISTAYNCVDRHVKDGRGDATAVIWDSPVTGSKEKFTYKQLLEEVETLAGVLREEGVRKGDTVLIYMPMIPAALFAMLAVSRLGAIHAVVFGGFAPASLAQRIEASKPRAILTASCGIEGNKKPLGYKDFIQGALQKSSHKPEKVIVWQRDQLRWDSLVESKGERQWQDLVQKAKKKGTKADCVPVKSNEGLYIIYTSGKRQHFVPFLRFQLMLSPKGRRAFPRVFCERPVATLSD